MKQITIDFYIYRDELKAEFLRGKEEGIALVKLWLETGVSLYKLLDIDEGDSISPYSNWGRIAKALGREAELHHPSSEEATCHQNSKECSTQE